jgi:hypothetical protein
MNGNQVCPIHAVKGASGLSVEFELSTLEPRIYLRLHPIRDLSTSCLSLTVHLSNLNRRSCETCVKRSLHRVTHVGRDARRMMGARTAYLTRNSGGPSP